MPNYINAPTELSGLVLWCRADKGIVLEGAGPKVEQWQDFSGNAHHLLQLGATNLKPTLSTGPNGTPAVLFDGVDDYMKALFALPQPQTVVVVYKPLVAAYYLFDDASSQFRMCQYVSGGTYSLLTPTQYASGNVGPASGQWLLASGVFNPQAYILRVNGVQLLAKTPGAAPPACAGLTLGATAAANGCANAAVAEIAVFNRVLSDGEITMIERYLARRYALTATGRVPVFSASDLPGLVGWYKAGQGLGFEPGTGKIAVWNDLSGLDHHLLQATSGKRPILTDGPIGRPAVLFDGVDDFMTAAFTLVQPETVVLAYKLCSIPAAQAEVFDGATFTSGMLDMGVGGTPIRLYAGNFTSSDATVENNGVYGVATALFNGGSSFLRFNGTQKSSGNCGAANLAGFTLGGSPNNNWSNIACAEVAIYNRALSTPEMQRLEHSWGAAYGLPVA